MIQAVREQPWELQAYNEIKDLGVEAITGKKVLDVRLIRDMNIAANLARIFNAREQHRDEDGNVNWSEWESNNPEEADALNHAAEEYEKWKNDKPWLE